jgi:structural maintenance of chromosome 3 (chondroitin sulfate proteoglycan 6)
MKYVSILTPSSDVIYLCSLLESRKSFVEIELNERLRRRRQELKIKLEMLNETNGDPSSSDDLGTRTRELRALKSSIETLTKKAQVD